MDGTYNDVGVGKTYYGIANYLSRRAPNAGGLNAASMVAVGAAVASRPPHGSRRALLTHRARPSGSGVETVTGQRV
jgi:hypothetical protein